MTEPRAGRGIPLSAVLVLAAVVLSGTGNSGCSSDRGGRETSASSGPASAWTRVDAQSPRLNLVLLTLDTTRRDHLSCYGFPKPTTPNLDRLAAEGILFENPIGPVPVTLAAHSTMMTGLYPFQHGVRNNGSFVLADSFRTLAETLKSQGYATGAVAGAFPVDHRFGLAQGFDSYDDHFPPLSLESRGEVSRDAREVTRLALAWVKQHQNGPFFLWAHYYDPHEPYAPPEPFRSKFPGDPYAGEVAYMDSQIGELVEGLRAQGLLEKTVFLVVGDHGEGLGDHVELTHTVFIYGSTQNVPMIARFPKAGPFGGKEWHGKKVAGMVGLTDLYATAVNALGLPQSLVPARAGQSLLPMVEGRSGGHDWVYMESLVPRLENWAADLRGIEEDGWKYIRTPRPELYNLAKDPGEKRNLASEEQARLSAMEAKLKSVLQGEPGTVTENAMDAETMEKLRSLGYISGTAAPTANAPTADAKDMIWIPMALARAQRLDAEYRPAEALAAVDSVLAAHPRTRLALGLRAACLSRLGRGTEALQAYDQALAECRGCSDELRLLQEQASACLSAGRTDEALKRVRDLIAIHPKEPGLRLILGDALQTKKDYEGAGAAFREESSLSPNEPLPWVKLGVAESARGRSAEAEAAFRKALALNPNYPDALVLLADLLDRGGRGSDAAPLLDQALAFNPSHPGANLAKGKLLAKRGDREGAIRLFKTGLQSSPNEPILLLELGNVYTGMNRNDEAAQCYRSAIATGRAQQGVYANLGVVYAQMGRMQDAIAQWETALKLDPSGSAAAAIRSNLERAKRQAGGGR